ncbi:hypothetical protein Q666_16945 [Marinobacter sp. ES-1]|uniref:hypothetical protein n=1 Tax=Marinobacter sp. ES-1 TaxID=1396858 RepID=UPI0003B83B5A|nr:hypothetical protein [Marinobacter sp. ES-1]ERP97082.1 hypothetical protein Q666_16945 [Marinobacter sp. ES-1]
MNLSTEEKAIVARLLTEKGGFRPAITSFLPYLLPVLVLALYGIVQQEYFACALAFFALFAIVVWYIHHTETYSGQLRSALQKYESEVQALGVDHEST